MTECIEIRSLNNNIYVSEKRETLKAIFIQNESTNVWGKFTPHKSLSREVYEIIHKPQS